MGKGLSEREKVVYALVKEYLEKNRLFDSDKILSYIHYKFKLSSTNINREGIKTILKTLIDKNLIVEGSKLYHEEILSNEKRKIIYEYILRNPSSLYTEIVNNLNLSNHVVIWHLNILEKFNFIEKGIVDNYEVYFEPDLNPEKVQKYFHISRPKSKKIINLLNDDNKGFNKSQISKILHMHNNTLSKYIEILESYGIILKKIIQNKTLYYLNQDNLELFF